MTALELATAPEPSETPQPRHFELPEELQHTVWRASELVRRQRTEPSGEPLPTALQGLDRLLGGGLPRGRLIELVGRGSCGRFASLLAALRAVTGAGEVAALVDQGSQLDPQVAAAVGVDLERLLWLQPDNTNDSLAAAEILLHTGFPLVALDLGLPPVRGRAPLAAWLRLSRTAAAHDAVVLAGVPYRSSGCAAAAVVVGGRTRGRWSGGSRSAHLLSGLETRFFLNKRLGHAGLGAAPVELTLPEARFGPPQPDHSRHDHEFEIRNSKSEILIEGRNDHVKAI
jgi:hypothetical protein